MQPEWWCRDPPAPEAEARRLERAMKLRPDVIAVLERRCTPHQVLGLLWLLQGKKAAAPLLGRHASHPHTTAVLPLPCTERNSSTFQEPIREVNSYLRKEVERLAKYRSSNMGEPGSSPRLPHPSAGQRMALGSAGKEGSLQAEGVARKGSGGVVSPGSTDGPTVPGDSTGVTPNPPAFSAERGSSSSPISFLGAVRGSLAKGKRSDSRAPPSGGSASPPRPLRLKHSAAGSAKEPAASPTDLGGLVTPLAPTSDSPPTSPSAPPTIPDESLPAAASDSSPSPAPIALRGLGLDDLGVSSGLFGLGMATGLPGGHSVWAGGLAGGSLGSAAGGGALGGAGALSEDAPPPTLLHSLQSVLASPPRPGSGQPPPSQPLPPGMAHDETQQPASPPPSGLTAPAADVAAPATLPRSQGHLSPTAAPRTLDFSSPQPGAPQPPSKEGRGVAADTVLAIARHLRLWAAAARGHPTAAAAGLTLQAPMRVTGSPEAVAVAMLLQGGDVALLRSVLATHDLKSPIAELAGHTLLTFAALHGLDGVQVVQLADALELDVTVPAHFGWTPLQCVALQLALSAARADPLDSAALGGVVALLRAGADAEELSPAKAPSAAAVIAHL